MHKKQKELRKQRQRKKKRNSLTGLNAEEKQQLVEFKENAWRRLIHSSGWNQYRTLKEINELHKKDFTKITGEFEKEFPNERITVLDEGAGQSTFGT